MIISGTGHRPPRLGLDYSSKSNRVLVSFVMSELQKLETRPVKVISGMAQGLDQALAHASLLLRIPLIAAIPFNGQESKWPIKAQVRYNAILSRAEEVVNVSPGKYSNTKFILRDEWMVNNADTILALWDGNEKGGTWHTVNYAISQNKPIINIFAKFMKELQNDHKHDSL